MLTFANIFMVAFAILVIGTTIIGMMALLFIVMASADRWLTKRDKG